MTREVPHTHTTNPQTKPDNRGKDRTPAVTNHRHAPAPTESLHPALPGKQTKKDPDRYVKPHEPQTHPRHTITVNDSFRQFMLKNTLNPTHKPLQFTHPNQKLSTTTKIETQIKTANPKPNGCDHTTDYGAGNSHITAHSAHFITQKDV